MADDEFLDAGFFFPPDVMFNQGEACVAQAN